MLQVEQNEILILSILLTIAQIGIPIRCVN